MKSLSILIIGASGFIGSKIYSYLKQKGMKVQGTYHANANNMWSENDKIYLNLNSNDFSEISKLNLKEINYVILCHGISNIDQCKTDSTVSYRVNVQNTVKILNLFRNSNLVPIYLSTNMVYSGNKCNHTEHDQPHPNTEYGKQKLEVENSIKSMFENNIILRLTKVFGVEKSDGTLFTHWIDKLRDNEKIYAASDVFISPVFIMDVLTAVESLIKNQHFGTYNLGGNATLSTYEFAKKIANYFEYSSNVINKVKIRSSSLIEKRSKYNSVNSKKIRQIMDNDLTSYEVCFEIIKRNYGYTLSKGIHQ